MCKKERNIQNLPSSKIEIGLDDPRLVQAQVLFEQKSLVNILVSDAHCCRKTTVNTQERNLPGLARGSVHETSRLK